VLLTAILHVPLFLVTYFALNGSYTLATYYAAIGGIGGFVLNLLAQGVVAYGVFQELRGTPASIGRCIAVGLQRLWPVLATGVLVGLLIVIGSVLLVIPGIIAALALYVAVPAAVVEGVSPVQALSRSNQLTTGYKGTIFGLSFLIGILAFAGDLALRLLTGSWEVVTPLYLYVSDAIGVVFGALAAVTGAVMYHDLRVTKEGVQTEELARVFD
jgi:hypothetical protein